VKQLKIVVQFHSLLKNIMKFDFVSIATTLSEKIGSNLEKEIHQTREWTA